MRDVNSTEIHDHGVDTAVDTAIAFEPERVFADPVAYLYGLGLRSELVETHVAGLRAAA